MNTSITSSPPVLPLKFYLRKIDEPFEWKCTPVYNEQIGEALINWALPRGNFKNSKESMHSIGCNTVYWTAISFPLVTSIEKFNTVSKYFMMFCTMDDHADESWGDGGANVKDTERYWKKAIALFETLRDNTPWHKKAMRNLLLATSGVPPYLREGFRYLKKILDELSSVQRNRYIDRYQQYMENAFYHVKMRGSEKNSDLETYKAYRVNSIASIPCTLMIEYLYDVALTDEEYYHPILQELERLCTLQIVFVNDLFSIFKEYKGTLENLNHPVAILVLGSNMTIQQAVDEVCNQIEMFQDEFIRVRDEWYASGETISSNVRMFITGMEYYMAGDTVWHRLSKRYHGARFEGLITTGTLEWGPEGTIYTPDKPVEAMA